METGKGAAQEVVFESEKMMQCSRKVFACFFINIIFGSLGSRRALWEIKINK